MTRREIDFSDLEIELLSEENYCKDFDCSKEDPMGLNEFYHKEVLNYQKERLGKTYIFLYEGKTIGFITLSMNKIERALILKKGDRLPITQLDFPAALIGRLAVDDRWQGIGVGTFICKWAIGRCIKLSDSIGCRYVILQTDEEHLEWYRRDKLGFTLYAVRLNRRGEIDYWLYNKIEI